jgi:hypothetical protein
VITALSRLHLTTQAGVDDAFAALAAAETDLHLPHPVEAHPVPQLGRVDAHLADEDALIEWAQAFGAVVVDHGAVWTLHLIVAGHRVELWTRPDPARDEAGELR